MTQPRFQTNDRVSLERWDRSNPPYDLVMGECVVVSVSRKCSESGWMVVLRNSAGRRIELDQNWVWPLVEI